MDGDSGPTSNALTVLSRLSERPYEYGLFAALRWLDSANPHKPRIGHARRIADDPVRLGQEATLAFSASTVASFHAGEDEHPPRLEQFAFGLFGPNGPMPMHLTEYVRDRARNFNDPSFARFADVFHHRMLGLFYRAWASARPTVQGDRPESDRFSCYAGSVCGVGTVGTQGRDAFPDVAKFYYAGRLACQTGNADGLVTMIRDFFGVSARVEEFVGRWMNIPRETRSRIGSRSDAAVLGSSATLGEAVWDRQSKFRIECGPLSLARYEAFLPGGGELARLIALVRNYLGDELDWDLRLLAERDEVPRATLGSRTRLGWTSWLLGDKVSSDRGDLVLDPALALNQSVNRRGSLTNGSGLV